MWPFNCLVVILDECDLKSVRPHEIPVVRCSKLCQSLAGCATIIARCDSYHTCMLMSLADVLFTDDCRGSRLQKIKVLIHRLEREQHGMSLQFQSK